MPLDLTAFSDRNVLRAIGEEKPEYVDILADLIERGMTDLEIVRMVAESGGSAQAMHYAAKILRALRSLP